MFNEKNYQNGRSNALIESIYVRRTTIHYVLRPQVKLNDKVKTSVKEKRKHLAEIKMQRLRKRMFDNLSNINAIIIDSSSCRSFQSYCNVLCFTGIKNGPQNAKATHPRLKHAFHDEVRLFDENRFEI